MIHILHPELAEMINNLQSQIARVRELHKRQVNSLPNSEVCAACYDNYPCQTIKALDGEQ
jgi:hypothetical protein